MADCKHVYAAAQNKDGDYVWRCVHCKQRMVEKSETVTVPHEKVFAEVDDA